MKAACAKPGNRLYHPLRILGLGLLLVWLMLPLSGCRAPERTPEQITVTIMVDGTTREVALPAGSTVAEALRVAGVSLGPLDRTDPPDYTLLVTAAQVRVIRVQEEFRVAQEIIPFERRVLRNEALPEGETRLLQAGVNGLREVTYRRLVEDGRVVSEQPVKSVVVREPQPEIVMVGVQSPFVPRVIPGRLAYLAAGNAWVMEGDTGRRRPVVTTGDLDGRVFTLSPDGRWLLFTRRTDDEEEAGHINALWAVDLDAEEPQPLALGVYDVVHFAAFAPGHPNIVYYSTVEPRPGPPGWQANNDLWQVTLYEAGPGRPLQVVEANAGGIYGWWGTTFAWDATGEHLAFARPDAVGEVDLVTGTLRLWLRLTPYQTRADWAWVPGVAWSPDGETLFTVGHGRPGETVAETSPAFHLLAIPRATGWPLVLAESVGMFAAPTPSPWYDDGRGGRNAWVAYLQAVFPTQSETSRYRLVVMDRDGSDRRVVFPPEGGLGLLPQRPVWSPGLLPDFQAPALAVIQQGNLYLVSALDGTFQQLTADGLVEAVDWR